MVTPQTPPPNAPKKKLPGWVKLLIVLALLVVGISVAASVGFRLVAGLLTSKAGSGFAEKGIEKGIEKLIEKGLQEAGGDARPDVDITKDGLVITDKKTGQQLAITGGQQLPSGFPEDIPVYSGAKVLGSMVMGPTTMVTLEAESPVADVSSFYQVQLTAKGWSQAFSTSPMPETVSSIYRKENRQVMVTASREGGKTSLVLAYGTDQP